MPNRLIDESSPYLQQHAYNPVNWYPWGEEAFLKAKAEDKPVFLSIGYSTCHWCHVMARESFEDENVARLLNERFVSIKVDREERPDVDSIYMLVCQAFTGSGGWPASIFLTPERKPFFAGTYFPKTSKYGTVGFIDLLRALSERWKTDRTALMDSAGQIVAHLSGIKQARGEADETLIEAALTLFSESFDAEYGGFGAAPKFPAPHQLLFLMNYFERSGDQKALSMAETTLTQMYFGGLYDHIGYGFCRYSTDRRFLVPHFEKMLYDNALLIMAYAKAYSITKKPLYRKVAENTAAYVLREMTGPDGGFYSAQDADSDGVEGKYYVFTPEEIIKLLGQEAGEAFNRHYGITARGNFEGKSIPNLLESRADDAELERYVPAVYEYRKQRAKLRTDDKILTAWNGLMIAALCRLYGISRNVTYRNAARAAQRLIENRLTENDTLFVSLREGKRGPKGFLDDYACYIFALLALHEATLENSYLERAVTLAKIAIERFYDKEDGGFYLYGSENEQLILRPKETYDGAMPSGNSMMAYNLVRIGFFTDDEKLIKAADDTLSFLSGAAKAYPVGHAMFLTALLDQLHPPQKITAVIPDTAERAAFLERCPDGAAVLLLSEPTAEYPLKDGKATYYVCRDRRCLPPGNSLNLLE